MIKQISHNQKLLGIIVTKEFHKEGIEFFTSNDMSQQMANVSESGK